MTINEYNKCVDQHADGLYRFILKNIKDKEKAQDVVQETFTKMWIKAPDVAFEKSKSYLFTAGYHTMIDWIRKEKRETRLEDSNLKNLAHSEQYSDLNEVLHLALDKLPEIQKSVILLRDYEGYSYEEIGEICNLHESQVKVYIYRARIFLKNYIGSIEAVV
jgi:RNA polymerase sigma factor (sigma-70 family)